MNTTPDVPAPLAPPILRILAETTVAADATSAVTFGRDVTADDPRALRAALAAEFYRRHHMGRSDDGEAPAPRPRPDPVLESRLLAAMPHRHIIRDVELLGDGDESGVPVLLDGVRVKAAPERLDTARPGAPARVPVRLNAARPAVSPGFFLCESTVPARVRPTGILRVYLHVTAPDAAPRVWADVLGLLEGEQLPYRAKIASSRTGYPRQDACVVYLGPESWDAAELIAGAARRLPGLGGTVSAFARQLAPGVGAAWEPDDARPGMRRVSFGEHRAAALAAGLTEHALDPTARGREQAVRDCLLEAGVDPADPAHNLTSPREVLPAPTPAAAPEQPLRTRQNPPTGLPEPLTAAGR